MEKKVRSLWNKALRGSSASYRKLKVMFLQESQCKRDRTLAKLRLEKAMEMGEILCNKKKTKSIVF